MTQFLKKLYTHVQNWFTPKKTEPITKKRYPWSSTSFLPTHSSPIYRYDMSQRMGKALHEYWDLKRDFTKYPKIDSEDKIWIYNISPANEGTAYFSKTVGRVINHPILRRVCVNPCPKDKEYVVVTSLPSVVNLERPVVDLGEIFISHEYGARVAMDLINPANLGLDQNYEGEPSLIGDRSRNLGNKGLFWSTTNPPQEKDLKDAVKRMKLYYSHLLQQAGELTCVLPKKELEKYITPEHHAAAEYFNITTVWHPVLSS